MKSSLKKTLNGQEERFSITYEHSDVSDLSARFREELLNDFYESAILDEYFAVPEDYIDFCSSVSSMSDKNGTWGFIYGGDSSLNRTQYFFKVHFIEEGDLEIILINIGHWSDKHEYWLCCDQRYRFGKIFDSRDLSLETLCEESADYVFDSIEDLVSDPF